MKKLTLLFLCILSLSIQIVDAQISVTANNSAAQLAQKLVGFGVTTANATLNCGSNASDGIPKLPDVL